MLPINRNPLCGPGTKPEWSHFTRLGGDRAAILFEYLRAQVGTIEGLVEDLHYFGDQVGWAPRYSVGEITLFAVHISPGTLEASTELAEPLRNELLAKARISSKLKQAIHSAPVHGKSAALRMPLADRAAVRAFANVVRMKSKIVEAGRTK